MEKNNESRKYQPSLRFFSYFFSSSRYRNIKDFLILAKCLFLKTYKLLQQSLQNLPNIKKKYQVYNK